MLPYIVINWKVIFIKDKSKTAYQIYMCQKKKSYVLNIFFVWQNLKHLLKHKPISYSLHCYSVLLSSFSLATFYISWAYHTSSVAVMDFISFRIFSEKCFSTNSLGFIFWCVFINLHKFSSHSLITKPVKERDFSFSLL